MSGTSSLAFADSFDHYSQDQIGDKWSGVSYATLGPGRNGTGCFLGTSGAPGSLSVDMLVANNGWVLGMAYMIQAAGGFANTIYSTYDTDLGYTFLSCVLNTDGTISLYGGDKLIGTSMTSLSVGTWYYLEIQSFTASTSTVTEPGVVTVVAGMHVNGIEDIGLGAVTTTIPVPPDTGAQANRHIISGCNGAFTGSVIDDVYIAATGGAGEANYLGDVKILCYLPTADESGNQWSGTYSDINSNPSTDGSSISDDTAGDQSFFAFQPIPVFTGTIPAVQSVVRGEIGTNEQFAMEVGTITSSAQGIINPQHVAITLSFIFFCQGWDMNLDPVVNAPWTPGNFNTETFGVIIVKET